MNHTRHHSDNDPSEGQYSGGPEHLEKDQRIQRAELLMSQDRFAEAEKEIRGYLAAEPDDPHAYFILAFCLAGQDKDQEALEVSTQLLQLRPDLPAASWLHSRCLIAVNRLKEAIPFADEAIRLEPEEPDYYALRSQLAFTMKEYVTAVSHAELGLQLDPEHLDCANIRTMSLVQMGKLRDADLNMDVALGHAPNDSMTHANKGWTLLHRNQPKEALPHFKEALRLEPDNDWARQGIIEALKARNFIYRMILMYFLWMSRLDTRVRWGLIIGMVVGLQLLLRFGTLNTAMTTAILSLAFFYMIFTIISWTASSIFDALLMLNKFGRLALSKSQKIRALTLCSAMLLNILACLGILGIAYLLSLHDTESQFSMISMLGPMIYVMLLIYPVAGTLSMPTLKSTLLVGIPGFGIWIFGMLCAMLIIFPILTIIPGLNSDTRFLLFRLGFNYITYAGWAGALSTWVFPIIGQFFQRH